VAPPFTIVEPVGVRIVPDGLVGAILSIAKELGEVVEVILFIWSYAVIRTKYPTPLESPDISHAYVPILAPVPMAFQLEPL